MNPTPKRTQSPQELLAERDDGARILTQRGDRQESTELIHCRPLGRRGSDHEIPGAPRNARDAAPNGHHAASHRREHVTHEGLESSASGAGTRAGHWDSRRSHPARVAVPTPRGVSASPSAAWARTILRPPRHWLAVASARTDLRVPRLRRAYRAPHRAPRRVARQQLQATADIAVDDKPSPGRVFFPPV